MSVFKNDQKLRTLGALTSKPVKREKEIVMCNCVPGAKFQIL